MDAREIDPATREFENEPWDTEGAVRRTVLPSLMKVTHETRARFSSTWPGSYEVS